uniref:Uncharacterized protein n=1 Tax=Ciona savignyi TaxID=51511 RepID=H2ZQ01_CIOSA
MSSNIELGLTLTEKFIGCLPQYFESDEDGNLHHDIRKANVFAEGRLFADAYKGEVVVESAAEFATIKQRLLTLPTFVEVSLKKSDSSALSNTTYTTTGKFIVYLNPSNPVIKNQLREKLDHVEMLMNQGKNFALEICLDDALKCWYEMRFRDGRNSSYEANGANICVTNFSRRFHECYHPLVVGWVLPNNAHLWDALLYISQSQMH